jgi:AcrR family transcriptional regulator
MPQESGLTAAGRRLLDAAADLFYAQGINAVGVAAIADSAGVTKKTLYDCFGSKDGIVVAYLTQRHDDWRKLLDARLASVPRSPLAVFDSYVDHLRLGRTVNGCGFINAAADLSATHPAIGVIRDHKVEVRRRLRDLLPTKGHTTRTREALATHLFYLLEGAVVHTGLVGDLSPLTTSRKLASKLVNG